MTTTRMTGRLLCTLSIVALAAHQARGVSTKIWDLKTAADFTAAKVLKDLSLHRAGHLHLAPKQIAVDGVDELLILCLTSDGKGNVYAGTGTRGRVIRIDAEGKATVLWQFAEQLVTSIALDAKGSLYAAVAVTGKVYKLIFTQGQDKPQVSVFCEIRHAYFWDMKFDRGGNLLVAGSLPEVLYSVSADGKATKLAELGRGHLSSVAIDQVGNVLTASEPEGIVYRVSPKRQIRVLYDAAEEGVHCLLVDKKGNVYLGTGGGAPGGRARPTRRKPSSSSRPRSSSATVSSAKAPPKAPSQVKGGPAKPNAVYKITPDGRVAKVFSPGKAYIYDMAFDAKGRLLVATGNDGKVYRIEDDEVTDLVDRGEAQILALLPIKGSEILMGTGNKGRLVRAIAAPSETGVFESPILDASFLARWGRVWWDADVPKGSALSLATRSGNSAKPDKTWSPYSAELAQMAGSKIQSPAGRYLQVRAAFKAPKAAQSPVMRRLRVAYLPDNQPPRVDSVTVRRSGNPGKPAPSKPGQKPPPPASSAAAKIEWKASDPNSDQLRYAVYYRGQGEKTWKLLKDKIEKTTNLAWHTDRVPDGEYTVKVVASDAPANPPGRDLNAEKVSLPLPIDNTRPKVEKLAVKVQPKGKCVVTGTAHDASSYIAKLEYAVDAGDWISFFPADHILDSSAEPFSFTIDGLKPGEHTIVVTAEDAAGNTGSAKSVTAVK